MKTVKIMYVVIIGIAALGAGIAIDHFVIKKGATSIGGKNKKYGADGDDDDDDDDDQSAYSNVPAPSPITNPDYDPDYLGHGKGYNTVPKNLRPVN